MNSIRPLVTITILTIVAVFLYMKINERPVRPVASGDAGALPETADGVPPLNAVDVNPSATDEASSITSAPPFSASAAPAWPTTGTNGEPASPPTNIAPVNMPAVPAIPELPGAALASEASPTARSASAPAELPSNIPMAQYPGEFLPESAAAADPSASPNTMAAPHEPATADPNAHATDSAMAAVGLTPQRDPSTAAPSAISSTVTEQDSVVTPPDGAPDAPPVEASFASSWTVIEAALERGELARAHQLLSQWYGEPSLAPSEKEQVDTLLSQLAGTVVYSTEHQLEPAHVVQAGETLEMIAAKYNVPWQLLAKINGITASDAVQPGQQLKVMRGPFSAVVDLGKNDLTLMLDGRYAGKFAISGPVNPTLGEGEWEVADTFDVPASGQPQRSLVLRRANSTSEPSQERVLLGAAPVESLKQLGIGFDDAVVALAPADADEVADILSVGSKVAIRR